MLFFRSSLKSLKKFQTFFSAFQTTLNLVGRCCKGNAFFPFKFKIFEEISNFFFSISNNPQPGRKMLQRYYIYLKYPVNL